MRNRQSPARPCRLCQTSTCSAIVIASSTSMPKYLTVLSIFWCPDGIYDPRHPNDRLLLGVKGNVALSCSSRIFYQQTGIYPVAGPSPSGSHRELGGSARSIRISQGVRSSSAEPTRDRPRSLAERCPPP